MPKITKKKSYKRILKLINIKTVNFMAKYLSWGKFCGDMKGV